MFKKLFMLFTLCLLAGCATERRPIFWKGETSPVESSGRKAPTVAVLLPLSGESSGVGEHLKNAAMMASFEHQRTLLKVLFFDTESTGNGAVQAYHWALAQKPDIVLGPVFSKEVDAIKKNGISRPLLSFTSDTSVVDSKVSTMAVTVPEQVRQIVRHACSAGQYRLAVLGPESKTGEIAMNALANAVAACPGMTLKKVSLYASNTMNFTDAVQKVAPRMISSKKKDLSEADRAELAKPASVRAGVDAVILFEEGIKLRQLLSLLAFYDMGPKDIPVYALTVVKQVNDNNANFVYFADLDETNYYNFSRQYKDTFGKAPIRIASQMYDAMGFVLTEIEAGRPIELDDLKTRDSYWGVDGLVRLNDDGTNRRALQLKQKRGERFTLIEPAESFFDRPVSSGWNAFNQPTTSPVD